MLNSRRSRDNRRHKLHPVTGPLDRLAGTIRAVIFHRFKLDKLTTVTSRANGTMSDRAAVTVSKWYGLGHIDFIADLEKRRYLY